MLSESSFFVFEDKIILKTCGTTTLLFVIRPILHLLFGRRFIKKVLKTPKGIDELISGFFFSHLDYIDPIKQSPPHRSFKDELIFLQHIFPHGQIAETKVAESRQFHLFAYISSLGRDSFINEQELSISEWLLFGISEDCESRFAGDRRPINGTGTALDEADAVNCPQIGAWKDAEGSLHLSQGTSNFFKTPCLCEGKDCNGLCRSKLLFGGSEGALSDSSDIDGGLLTSRDELSTSKNIHLSFAAEDAANPKSILLKSSPSSPSTSKRFSVNEVENISISHSNEDGYLTRDTEYHLTSITIYEKFCNKPEGRIELPVAISQKQIQSPRLDRGCRWSMPPAQVGRHSKAGMLASRLLSPGSQLDQFRFDPLGYSMNAFDGRVLFNAHLAPEAASSYSSFETNAHFEDASITTTTTIQSSDNALRARLSCLDITRSLVEAFNPRELHFVQVKTVPHFLIKKPFDQEIEDNQLDNSCYVSTNYFSDFPTPLLPPVYPPSFLSDVSCQSRSLYFPHAGVSIYLSHKFASTCPPEEAGAKPSSHLKLSVCQRPCGHSPSLSIPQT